MPKRPAEEQLVGDVAVGLCPYSGLPLATLVHPDGGSCQVAVSGASLMSWRPAREGGADRLLPVEDGAAPGASAGLQLCGFGLIPPSAWAVETLVGRKGNDGPLVLTLFAEVPAASASTGGGAAGDGAAAAGPPAPLAARATFSLWPNRLTVGLQVANALDDEEDGGLHVEVNLGCCGLQGHCGPSPVIPGTAAAAPAAEQPGPVEPGETPESAVCLLSPSLRLSSEGFSALAAEPSAAPASVAATSPAGTSVRFRALASEPVALGPGQALEGEVSLELV